MDVKLVLLQGGKKQQVFRLRSEETVLGRKRECDIRIPSGEVSRQHCRLTYEDGYLMVEDLKSANGTFLNGALLEDVELVRPGDELSLGPVTFRAAYLLTPEAEAKFDDRDGVPVVEEAEPEVELEPVVEEELVEEEEEEILPVTPGFADEDDFGLVEEEEKEAINPYSRRRAPKQNPLIQESASDLEPEPDSPAEVELDDAWQLPPDEDVRDLFSDLDDDDG